jgi:hypothetical protein
MCEVLFKNQYRLLNLVGTERNYFLDRYSAYYAKTTSAIATRHSLVYMRFDFKHRHLTLETFTNVL